MFSRGTVRRAFIVRQSGARAHLASAAIGAGGQAGLYFYFRMCDRAGTGSFMAGGVLGEILSAREEPWMR